MATTNVPSANIGMSDLADACGVEIQTNLSLNGLRAGNGGDLTTTDTYFPHLFVEVGLIGALAYLLILFAPLLFLRWKKTAYQFMFVLYFALFFDSLFSYSLNNIAFLVISLLFVYPVHYYTMHQEEINPLEQDKHPKRPLP